MPVPIVVITSVSNKSVGSPRNAPYSTVSRVINFHRKLSLTENAPIEGIKKPPKSDAISSMTAVPVATVVCVSGESESVSALPNCVQNKQVRVTA